jgi:hypothetical protein
MEREMLSRKKTERCLSEAEQSNNGKQNKKVKYHPDLSGKQNDKIVERGMTILMFSEQEAE